MNFTSIALCERDESSKAFVVRLQASVALNKLDRDRLSFGFSNTLSPVRVAEQLFSG